jgi:hypothetical protein
VWFVLSAGFETADLVQRSCGIHASPRRAWRAAGFMDAGDALDVYASSVLRLTSSLLRRCPRGVQDAREAAASGATGLRRLGLGRREADVTLQLLDVLLRDNQRYGNFRERPKPSGSSAAPSERSEAPARQCAVSAGPCPNVQSTPGSNRVTLTPVAGIYFIALPAGTFELVCDD